MTRKNGRRGQRQHAHRSLNRAVISGKPTEDERLLASPQATQDFTHSDPWRVFRIMGEFVEGFDAR